MPNSSSVDCCGLDRLPSELRFRPPVFGVPFGRPDFFLGAASGAAAEISSDFFTSEISGLGVGVSGMLKFTKIFQSDFQVCDRG